MAAELALQPGSPGKPANGKPNFKPAEKLPTVLPSEELKKRACACADASTRSSRSAVASR